MNAELVWPALAAILAMAFVGYLVRDVISKPRGNDKMKEISDAVQLGASAFLKREFAYVGGFVVLIFIALSVVPMLGVMTGVAFLLGAGASALAGVIGMQIATRANSRTAEAARIGVEDEKDPKKGLHGALRVAISGGAVMGMSVVGIALLGLVITIWILGLDQMAQINGYALGASLVALFARSGGGIFTKGADMGADLVGKVEAGIPEDDPRNPATIADNVGDNVGDVAGLGADLMESYVESIIAAMALAAAMGTLGSFLSGAAETGVSAETIVQLQLLPLMIASVGIVASILGILSVRLSKSQDPQASLMNGTYVAAGLTIAGTLILCATIAPKEFLINGKTFTWLGIFWSTVAGIVAGGAVGFFSEYYTSSKFQPTRHMADGCRMGPAITVTDGLAIGMKSCALPVITLGLALLVAYWAAHFYGIALAAIGMLATTGMIVAVDAYGPIADNAGGCAEMAGLDPGVRKITDNLDSVGNTTAAIGKGFAIGSAAFAALGLLVAFMLSANVKVADLSLARPTVIFGLLLGAMIPFFFSSLLFGAVRRAAFAMIAEVRRQFKEMPGIMTGETKPDYAKCVAISTDGAIRGMLVPGSLALVVPVVVGVVFGSAALAGLLIGSLSSGLMLGIMCANSGGAMDNAKKYIEEGKVVDSDGVVHGKGSDAHKAGVIGDTVGDPLKDTVGPSINILIKLMAVVSLVLAPLFARLG
ncbi:MAG: sodium-translocating pyrophosphatase [Sumerlaeia bacterium]